MNNYSKERLRLIADKIDSVCNAMPHLLGLIAEIRTSSNSLSLCTNPAYSVDLSKSISVTPERHSGFFVPVNCATSQVEQPSSARPAAALRLQSVYDGWTSQNKSVMANMRGGSVRPRVTPVTLSDSQADRVKSQNLLGVSHD